MSVREGMRRLGLAAGVVGASLGVYASYFYTRDLLTQRGNYIAFRSLVSSSVAQKEIASLKKTTNPIKPPPGYTLDLPDKNPPETLPADFFDRLAARSGDLNGWQVNKGGIKTIYFGKNQEVASIERDDGTRVYRADPPSLWTYLLVLALPVLGFFLPWMALRAITWIGFGFFDDLK